jgi:hypothetical protein
MCHPGRPGPHGEAGLLCLPESEIRRVSLEMESFSAFPLIDLIQLAVGELAIELVGADREVDVPLGGVGMPGLDQPLDQRDDPADALGGKWLGVRPAEPQAVGVGDIVGGHLLREILAAHPGGRRGGVDLVVDVGDVGDESHLVALAAQEPGEPGEDDEGPGVADVDAPVDGRPAGVDPYAARLRGIERPDLTGEGVVQGDGSHPGEP